MEIVRSSLSTTAGAFALDNRCSHTGFLLDRGSVEDGILTCHRHHARFDRESGCTFDLRRIDRQRTSVGLEDQFYEALSEIAPAHK